MKEVYIVVRVFLSVINILALLEHLTFYYHKVNLNSDNQIYMSNFHHQPVLSPPCSDPSAAVLCHNSPEEVTWLVMKI